MRSGTTIHISRILETLVATQAIIIIMNDWVIKSYAANVDL